jgi:uncharacterized protein (UPF0335 family)
MIDKANDKGDRRIGELLDDKKSLSDQLQNINRKLKKIIDSIESGSLKSFVSLNRRIEDLESEKAAIEDSLKSVGFKISEIENHRLSSEIMSQSFKTFKDIYIRPRPEGSRNLYPGLSRLSNGTRTRMTRPQDIARYPTLNSPTLSCPQKNTANRMVNSDSLRVLIGSPSRT